jgi:hypothetical protein
MIHELRRYVTQPGRRDEWVVYMEGIVIPFMLEKGMDVKGSFLDDEDPDGYVWIRSFTSEEQRKALYGAVYESTEWTETIGPVVYSMLDVTRSVVTRIVPTDLPATWT